MKNTLIVLGITVIVLAILGAGIYTVMQHPPGQKTLSEQIGPGDHILGDPTTAKVALVEYGDYQCPACGYWHPIVKQLAEQYNGRMILVFRNFPLPQHQNAIPSAYAAEAASKQGKFWEMYDLIYGHQADWKDSVDSTAIFAGYARQLGLNVDQFKADMAATDVRDRVQRDIGTGQASNVNSTPSFFLNGTYITPADGDQFKQLIDAALK